MLMNFINSVVSAFMRRSYGSISDFRSNAVKRQKQIFAHLLSSASNTKFGQEHGFKDIKSYTEFATKIPLRDYDQMKPYIERAMRGEADVLWPGKVELFAKSSGTTGDRSKFIPVTAEFLRRCHYTAGTQMLMVHCKESTNASIFSGKSLTLGGSHKIVEVNKEAVAGDLSALLMQNLPSWARFFRTPKLSIALMDEWESKLEAIAEECIPQNITNIVGVSSWTLVLMKKILEKTGKKHIHEVWPNLEVFFHGGVSFTPYKEQFQAVFPGKKMKYVETYNASEGFFGIEDVPGSGDLLLMANHGIFYEFIPVEQVYTSNPRAYELDEVEKDVNYAMVISTSGGLWRYLIGDTVRFTSIAPYRIKITGRTKHFINAFGEELMIENAEKALSKACEQTGAAIVEYTAGPVFMGQGNTGGHEWLIEFEKEPEDLRQFIKILDDTLKSVNSDYDAKRNNDFILNFPVVHKMQKNTFHKWLKARGKLGGQNKVPRLSNDRKLLEEILHMHEL
jgi:hypothetical protein